METLGTSLNWDTIENDAQVKWGWFIALGVTLLGLGIFAFSNLMTATTISLLYVGAFMVIGGVIQMAHSIQVKSWSGFSYYMMNGLFYGIAGVIAFQNPLLAAAALTIFLALALVASGAMRIWSSFNPRSQIGRGWSLASGITTFLVGFIFLFSWPINSIWLLGMILAIDLTFQGVAYVAFGMILKNLNQTSGLDVFSSSKRIFY